MDFEDDIERQIMLEMEAEIARNKKEADKPYQMFSAILPTTAAPQEDDKNIEEQLRQRQLRRKREEEEKARQEAEERARQEAEERARQEAEERARQEAEEQARIEAEERARQEAEERARQEAEERARQEAEERARQEAEERARQEAEEQARIEAEERARQEAEERARQEAEERARQEAEERARQEAEERARQEAEERARQEAEERARIEAEERARQEAEERARQEAEERARQEAEEQARIEAEERARQEAEERARQEAEERARQEAEERARQEAEERARQEAEERARQEAEEQARIEAEERARQEAEERARQEAEERARQEAEERARQEAEERARQEAEEQARIEAEERARQEAEERARQEAEERARQEAEERARQEAEERARQEAEEQARIEAEERARQEAEERARQEAEERARQEAEERARQEAEERARQEAEEQARIEAEERARQEAEERARQEAEERARQEAEERARQEAEEQARIEAEERARQEAEERARQEAEERARQEAEEQARIEAEERARQEAEERARQEAEEQARIEAEERARQEAEERARQEAEEQARIEAEERARQEAEEQARIEAEERARQEAEERARQEAEERARQEAEEQARIEAEERARQEAEERARQEAEEQARIEAEERARQEAEEQARIEAEERVRQEAKERARQEAEERARQEAEEQARIEAEERARQEAEESPPGEPARRLKSRPASRLKRVRQEAEERARQEAEEQARIEAEERARQEAEERARQEAEEQARIEAEERARQEAEERARQEAEEQARIEAEERARQEAEEQARIDAEVKTEGGAEPKKASSPLPAVKSEVCVPPSTSGNVEVNSAKMLFQSALLDDDGDHGEAPDLKTGVPCVQYEDAMEKYAKTLRMDESTLRRANVCYETFKNMVEEGTCLFPPEEDSAAAPIHVQVQLNILQAKQTIISLKYDDKGEKNGQIKESSEKLSLTDIPLYYENKILADQEIDVLDNECPFNSVSEEVVTKENLLRSESRSLQQALCGVSYGDPMDLWEKASGGDNPHQQAKFLGAIQHSDTSRHIWVSGVEVTKPIPPIKMFNCGRLIEIRMTKFMTKVTEIHGVGTDPLLCAAALYCVTKERKKKVSETFYFGNDMEIFFPHHEPRDEIKDNCVVTFVPNEFQGSLYIIARIYRPSNYNFETFFDLYIRPDKYKNVHVAPMKQDTLLLTQSSDVLQELGWMAAAIESGNRLVDVSADVVTRKPFSDSDLMEHLFNNPARLSFHTIPMQLEFKFRDRTSFEVSFPCQGTHATPEERETVVSLLDPNVPGAEVKKFRFSPCCLFILTSGYLNNYMNVFYLNFSYMKLQSNSNIRFLPSTHNTFYIHVCVKDTDDVLTDEGALPCIYGRGIDSMKMVSSAYSSAVVSVSMDWALSDEFKVQLPLNLTNRHHFFLTLYAAYTKPGTSKPPVKVGYAAIPIMEGNSIKIANTKFVDFVIAEKAAAASAGGYLDGFQKAKPSHFVNGGGSILTCSCQTKSSVYATNKMLTSVFSGCGKSLEESRIDDDVLQKAGSLVVTPSKSDPHAPVISAIGELGLPHIVGHYPFLCSYAMAIIGSPSKRVTMPNRLHMLDVLLLITSRTEHYERSSHAPQRYQTKIPASAKTSAENILYHFLTNDVLYEGDQCSIKCRLYAGMTEVWLKLLRTTESDNTPYDPSARNLLREMSDLSWYLFDVIVRSAYIWSQEAEGGFASRVSRQLFDPSFYSIVADLCLEAIRLLSAFDESALVRRVALFLRNLMRCTDRGQMLIVCSRVTDHFLDDGNLESLTNFLSYLLDDPDFPLFFLPCKQDEEPSFLAPMLIKCFSTLLLQQNRDTRVPAGSYLYLFLRRMTQDSRFSICDLRRVAGQLFPLVVFVSSHWKQFMSLNERSAPDAALTERRKVILVLLWILRYTPVGFLNKWLTTEKAETNIAGFFFMMSEAQSNFRYDERTMKFHGPATDDQKEEMLEWDARLSFFVNSIGIAVARKSLTLTKDLLQTVKKSRASPCVFPFFVLIESILHLRNSTRSLQLGSALLLEVVRALLPEIMSGKAKMCDGVVFLAFRLMSSSCQFVRRNASMTYFFMCQVFFAYHNSLTRMKTLTANALVTVAEMKTRDLRFAGSCIEYQFEDLLDRSKVEEENFIPPSPGYAERYEEDPSWTSGDARMAFTHLVEPAYTSVVPIIQVPSNLTRKKERSEDSFTSFSEEFGSMAKTVLHLFNDVLPLRVDTSMLFKEPKCSTYLGIFMNFLHQNAVKEGLKWLYRLRETHVSNGDHIEAGMVLVVIAALGFRVTELFYHAKGKNSKGARFPNALLDYVFWHDYVRILPEIEKLFPVEVIYPIASQLYVCPDEPCFTMEGQIKILKEAAEEQDKGMHYELSLQTISIVDHFVRAAKDYAGAEVVHRAMASWCSVLSDPRPSNTYFFLWARMERAEPSAPSPRGSMAREERQLAIGEKPEGLPAPTRTIRRVYKMPPHYTLDNFRVYVKDYICSLFSDPSVVQMTDDLRETRAAPQNKAYKRGVSTRGTLNQCLVTTFEVVPHIPQRTTRIPEGYDKKVRLSSFQRVTHVVGKTADAERIKIEDVPDHRMKILTYELETAFPSTVTAIDVAKAEEVLLNPVETSALIIQSTCDTISSAPEDKTLVLSLKEALSIHGLPPGAFFKAAIAVMGHKEEINRPARILANLVRSKMDTWIKLEVVHEYPEAYAALVNLRVPSGILLIWGEPFLFLVNMFSSFWSSFSVCDPIQNSPNEKSQKNWLIFLLIIAVLFLLLVILVVYIALPPAEEIII
eukprot:gene912-539_t